MKLRSIAGSTAANAGSTDGYGPDARFNDPDGIALSSDQKKLYICDSGNNSLRLLDLDTSEVTTLTTGLAARPKFIHVDSEYLIVVTGPASGSAVSHIYDIDLETGAINNDTTLPVRCGSVARIGSTNTFLLHYGVNEFAVKGQKIVTHDPGGTFSLDSGFLIGDGAFPGEAGSVSVGSHVAGLIGYYYPSGTLMFYSDTMSSGYITPPTCRHIAKWDESSDYWSVLGASYGTDSQVRLRFTDTTFLGWETINLGFSTYYMKGIAADNDTRTLFFSGVNQIFMTTLSSRWTTRALL